MSDTLHSFVRPLLALDEETPESLRESILDHFHNTYSLYERLFDVLVDDDAFYVQPEPLRHPHIFYFGHTATLYVNKLILAGLIDGRINPTFESTFAVGVDEMSWDDLSSSSYDWPAVDEVRAYRDRVREVVDEVIRTTPLSAPLGWDDPIWAVLMGIDHERIHLETSSVLIRQTPLEHLRPPTGFWRRCEESGEAPANELLPVPGATVRLGKPREHRHYGWDNEYGTHEAEVAPFHASRYLVSNGEYLAFVEDGGYQHPELWTPEGRRWLEFTQVTHPVFWVPEEGGGYRYRAMLEEIEMPWSWPVDVNCHEARAFCAWKSEQLGRPLRLPTEEEWYALFDHATPGDAPAPALTGNVNLAHFASSCPVDTFAFEHGFCDASGNVWQWTETPIDAYEGFEVHPYYDDFSTPTFDGKHNMLKGGSWISTGNEIDRHSRYAFRRHFYQHAGFRYVDGPELPDLTERETQEGSVYETDESLAQYCEFHYGPEALGVANFPKRCAEVAAAAMGDRPKRRALDLGCATGRSTFELARHFDFVQGLDFTARFVRLGTELKERGVIRYEIPTEGDLREPREVTLEDLGLVEAAARVEFWQADACNLKPNFTGYDLIFAGNLIDRLYDPARFLSTIHERLNDGGLFILTSPYTWLEEFTDREHWIGGYLDEDGEPVTTLDGLDAILGEHFERVDGPFAIPFVIRETARKHQHTLSECTVWEKRG